MQELVGCPHNAERTITYPERRLFSRKNRQYTTYVPGDLLNLTCPHGCLTIQIFLKDRNEK